MSGPTRVQVLDVDEHLQDALRLAHRYLNRRDRTEGEVRDHLQGKGLDTNLSERAVLGLQDQGYLDDARFARLFAQDKRQLDQWGDDRIRRALAARGVDRELVEAALSEQELASELDRALALLRRRFPAAPRDRREHERALGVLLRKGYDPDLAVGALRRYEREKR